jgi:hypothetical protein
MACARCGSPDAPSERRWCATCERAFDAWSRRYASDVVWEVLAGTAIVAFVGMGLPLLGLDSLIAATGVFGAFGTFVGLHRLNGRRRRRQYLRGGAVPRAYLPGKT